MIDEAKDRMEREGLGYSKLGRMRQRLAKEMGFPQQDEVLPYLIDQLLNMLFHSSNVVEIYADDVKCSHGSTTGQLDDEQLFFLRSRGFDHRTARIMLAHAFASEVLEGVLNPALRTSLTEEMAARLSHSSVVEDRS